MCFSATASFSASVILTGIGMASMGKVKEPSQYALAGIPILFGVQQFVEGLLWISLTDPSWSHLQGFTTYAFLVIAQVIWPVWLPTAFMLFEKDPKRKKWMKLFIGTGVLIAAYFLYCLLAVNVSASVRHNHIFYNIDFPKALIPVAAFVYVISTSVPQLVSANNKIKWMGIAIFLFYVLSRLYFQPNLISVWCFFGTFIGILVFVVIHESTAEKKMNFQWGKNPLSDSG